MVTRINESGFETVATPHTIELAEELETLMGTEIRLDYWNRQHHISFYGRHRFAGDEHECRSYMLGALAMLKINN